MFPVNTASTIAFVMAVKYVFVSNVHVFAAVFFSKPLVPANAAIAVKSASAG